MRTCGLFMAAVLLFGCASGTERQAADNAVAARPAEADASAANTAAPAQPVADTPEEASDIVRREEQAQAIPEKLRGRWGLVAADCEPGRSNAKGLLEIGERELRFYESLGRLATVAEREETRLVADFAFTGEGMEWARRTILDAQDGGRTLIRREEGADAMPGVLRYERCPAERG